MNNNYSTQDFYFASYLLTQGCRMTTHIRRGSITTFFFEEDKKLHELVSLYYSFNARIEPVSYANSLRSLKSIIHNNSNLQLNDMYNNGNNNNIM